MAEHLDSDSLDVADILVDLAECMAEQDNPAAAEIFQKKALSIREKANPRLAKRIEPGSERLLTFSVID